VQLSSMSCCLRKIRACCASGLVKEEQFGSGAYNKVMEIRRLALAVLLSLAVGDITMNETLSGGHLGGLYIYCILEHQRILPVQLVMGRK